jgi:hypothetical protein
MITLKAIINYDCLALYYLVFDRFDKNDDIMKLVVYEF